MGVKLFSIYDCRKPLEQVVSKGEFSGIIFVNIHYYMPGESHSIHSHSDHEEIFICFQGKGTAITDEGEIDISRVETCLSLSRVKATGSNRTRSIRWHTSV